MDRKQLVIIAVTALVTFTITETAKWLAAFAKKTAVSETTKQQVKKIFNKSIRSVIWDVLWLAWFLVLLITNMRETTPVKRVDILIIFGLLLAIFLYVISLIWHVIGLLRERRSIKNEGP